jgi:GTPase
VIQSARRAGVLYPRPAGAFLSSRNEVLYIPRMQPTPEQITRAGHVALVGRPNVGKSTLMNALLGEKLSIVTPKAQTTRESVTGILTTDTMHAIFVDTPGLLEPKYALQRAMHETAVDVLRDADLVLLLLDGTRPGELPPIDVVEILRRKGTAISILINKIDAAPSDAVEMLEAWAARELAATTLHVSAVTGTGIDELKATIEARLPASPFYYPADDLAVQPVRFFVAELIRETIFELYEQEVPYSTIARVEEFREAEDPLYIRATVYVERETQKPIIIGKGGAGIRELGRRSREKIELFLDRRVYLDLWIKVLPNWRAGVETLRYLGYRLPPSMASAGHADQGPARTRNKTRDRQPRGD